MYCIDDRFELSVCWFMVFQKADLKTSMETNKRLSFLNSQFMCLCRLFSSRLWPRNQLRSTIFLNTYLNYETQTLGLSIFAVLFFTLLQNVYLLWRGNLNLFAKLCSLMPVCWCNTFKNNYWLLIHTDWLPSLTELNVSGVFCAVCNWMEISEP